jgi:NADP-dependent 3-hydroxy acid dehydrogenase YdfG
MEVSRALKKLTQRYPNKRVLVTGATSGLGEALAVELPETGRAMMAWMYRKQLWKFAPTV